MHEGAGYDSCSRTGKKILGYQVNKPIPVMRAVQYEKVPLTADEKDLLLTIYDGRRRLLLIVYVILISMAFAFSQRIDYRARYSSAVNYWQNNNDDAKFVSRFGMKVLNFCFLESMVIGTGLFFLFKRVLPLKKDADSGVKEKVPYEILKKEYYAVNERYYFAINDPALLHFEVDWDAYHSLNEGDDFYIYRGTKSRFVFENSGKYTIL